MKQNSLIDTNDIIDIVFGMGCFWGAEKKLSSIPGVKETKVGYAGGNDTNPTYEKVCSGVTGHAEVVLVSYSSKEISLNSLLTVFWESHDPTQINRQGNDIGSQYRSVIYWTKQFQEKIIKKSVNTYQQNINKICKKNIQTEIKFLNHFFLAEEYHQKYLLKNPNGYCGLKGLNISFKDDISI